jgi:hypothetical protein
VAALAAVKERAMAGNGWWRIAAASLTFLLAPPSRADEVTLYRVDGQPVAYIDSGDAMTIRMWTGEAVAYVENTGDGFLVYGFNGRHLGWFERGVIWNTGGFAQCAIRQVLSVAPYAEPAKFAKYAKLAKSAPNTPWAKPAYTSTFDRVPCDTFLKTGDAAR